MNRCFFTGNLVSDPTTGSTDKTGQAYTKFTIAVDRGGAGVTKSCDFIPVEAWAKLAAPCFKHLKKGSKVSICGSLRINTRKNDNGAYSTFIAIRADEVDFCSPSANNAMPGEGDNNTPYENLKAEEMVDPDNIPF